MENYSQKDIPKTIQIIASTISMFEQSQKKCEGTFEFILLKKWIEALIISQNLLASNNEMISYSVTDLEKALRRISSITKTMESNRAKYDESSVQYQKFTYIIEAMHITKYLFRKSYLNSNKI